MARAIPDATMDKTADDIAGANLQILCSAEPTTYTEAFTTYKLASIAMSGGDFSKADGSPNGRTLTVAAKTGATVHTNGDGTHVALVNTTASSLRNVTVCASVTVNTAGTANFGSYSVRFADPVSP